MLSHKFTLNVCSAMRNPKNVTSLNYFFSCQDFVLNLNLSTKGHNFLEVWIQQWVKILNWKLFQSFFCFFLTETALIVGSTLGGIVLIAIIAGIILVLMKRGGSRYRAHQLLLTEDDTDNII